MRYAFIKLIFLVLIVPVVGFAQNPTKWSLSFGQETKYEIKSGEALAVHLQAEIEPGWHLYALDQPEGGPIPTTIKVSDGRPFTLRDSKYPPPKTRSDPNF